MTPAAARSSYPVNPLQRLCQSSPAWPHVVLYVCAESLQSIPSAPTAPTALSIIHFWIALKTV